MEPWDAVDGSYQDARIMLLLLELADAIGPQSKMKVCSTVSRRQPEWRFGQVDRAYRTLVQWGCLLGNRTVLTDAGHRCMKTLREKISAAV